MNDALTMRYQVHLDRAPDGRIELKEGEAPPAPVAVPAGRVPRVSKLLALALRFEKLVRSGEVRDYAEIARLGRVTRARVSQIMNLVLLAPEIQEEILHFPAVLKGRDPVTERDVRHVQASLDWAEQRRRWASLRK